MRKSQGTGFRRLIAFALDWLTIALWAGLLFGVTLLLSGGSPRGVSNPWTAPAIGFLSMTLPVTLYFSMMEGSKWAASLGKRIVGLRVFTLRGERLSFSRAFLRKGLKFVPWELGHLVAQQAFYSGDKVISTWVCGALVFSVPPSLADGGAAGKGPCVI